MNDGEMGRMGDWENGRWEKRRRSDDVKRINYYI